MEYIESTSKLYEEWDINLKSKPFWLKLWSYFTIFTIIIFCILWLVQIVFLQNFYNDMMIKKIKNDIYDIIEAQDDKNLIDIIDNIAYRNSLLIFMTDWNGNVIYTTDEHSYKKYRRDKEENQNPYRAGSGQLNWQKGAFRNLPEEYNEFLQKLSESDDKIIEYKTENGNSYVYGTVIDSKVLYISKALGSVDSTVDILRSQLVWVTAALFVLSFIISYFISYRFAKPIKNISRQIQNIGKENCKTDFVKGFCKELDELSNILNQTSYDLIKVENYRREFFANISHDLRTPLTMIKGYAEMIRDFSWEEKETRDSDLDIIIRESDRLTGLVNEILEYSSLQSGTKKYNMQKVNISEITENVLNQFTVLCKKNNISIEKEIENELYAVCDEQSISRVIYNLIDNAISYAGESKKVYVSVNIKKDKVRFEVCDFGKGIDENYLPYIWDRYFTVKQQKRNKIGSGLGLAISKEILLAHNAEYGAKSSDEEGTLFWFELDIADIKK